MEDIHWLEELLLHGKSDLDYNVQQLMNNFDKGEMTKPKMQINTFW